MPSATVAWRCSWAAASAHNYGTIKQDTTHLGLYGQTNWNKLSADWSAAYGRSESKVNGRDWSQRAIQLDGRLSYNHALSDQWSVNASYTAEVVENANAHSVNVGATYKS